MLVLRKWSPRVNMLTLRLKLMGASLVSNFDFDLMIEEWRDHQSYYDYYEEMNVWTKFHGNTSNNCTDISIKQKKSQILGGTGGKIRGSPKLASSSGDHECQYAALVLPPGQDSTAAADSSSHVYSLSSTCPLNLCAEMPPAKNTEENSSWLRCKWSTILNLNVISYWLYITFSFIFLDDIEAYCSTSARSLEPSPRKL